MQIERLEPRYTLSVTILTVMPPSPLGFAVPNGEMAPDLLQTPSPPTNLDTLKAQDVLAGVDRIQEVVSGAVPSDAFGQPNTSGQPNSSGQVDTFGAAKSGQALLPLSPGNVLETIVGAATAQRDAGDTKGPPPSQSESLTVHVLTVGPSSSLQMPPGIAGQFSPGSPSAAPELRASGMFIAFSANGMFVEGIGGGEPPPFIAPSMASFSLPPPIAMAITAATTNSGRDLRWTNENALSAPAVSETATASMPFESVSLDTSLVPISRGSLFVKGETPYCTRTAVTPEIDLSTDLDHGPSVWSDIGQVERTAPTAPTPASESQATAFLDIAAPDMALQSPSESGCAAASIVVSRTELALDRVMGQVSTFTLDSSGLSPIATQDEAVAQNGNPATVGQPAPAQAATVSEAPPKEADHAAAPTWQHGAAGSVAVMLLVSNRLFFGKSREEDDEKQPSQESV
jgi:hypothetical protein